MSPECQAPRAQPSVSPEHQSTHSPPGPAPNLKHRVSRAPPAPRLKQLASQASQELQFTPQHLITNKTHTPASSSLTGRASTKNYCLHCRRRGHKQKTCSRKAPCKFCQRYCHTIKECHTCFDQERQENLFRQLSAEQARNNAWLLHSLKENFVPTQDSSQVGG